MTEWNYLRILFVLAAILAVTCAYAFAKQARENKRIWEAIEELRK